MAFTTVLTKTINLPVDGVVEVDGVALLGFPSGAARWGLALYIDGQLVWAPQGDVANVTINLGGIKACAKGERLIELKWSAANTVRLHSAFLKIKGFNNTSGV